MSDFPDSSGLPPALAGCFAALVHQVRSASHPSGREAARNIAALVANLRYCCDANARLSIILGEVVIAGQELEAILDRLGPDAEPDDPRIAAARERARLALVRLKDALGATKPSAAALYLGMTWAESPQTAR